MPAPGVTVCCVKWGTAYKADYARTLQRAVYEHLSLPHRFVCLTDDPTELGAHIESLQLPDTPAPRDTWGRGCWPKLNIFREGIFADDELVLYLDLDVMITGGLDELVARVRDQGGLHIIREWNPTIWSAVPTRLRPDRGGNSSVVGFRAGEQRHIIQTFLADPEGSRRNWFNDQVFINHHAAGKQYWPLAWCRSFRRSCVWHYPLNYAFRPRLPAGTRILVFHGTPKPVDLLGPADKRWGSDYRYGFGPVPWVQEYWNRYAVPAAAAEARRAS